MNNPRDLRTWSDKDLKKFIDRFSSDNIQASEHRAEQKRRYDSRMLWLMVVCAVGTVAAVIIAVVALLK